MSAGSTVQANLSSADLAQFNVTIGLNLQNKLQDWPSRQQLQYGAVKGLATQDFHGLQDFDFQMSLYSSTHPLLESAWKVIKSIVPNNPKLLATLLNIPGFGKVGMQVLSLVGIQNIVVAPQSILKSSTQLNATITSLS